MFKYLLKFWFPLAIAGTIVMFAVYVAIQQDIRIGANDLSIQTAEDGAAALASGTQSPASLIGSGHIDIDKSLAPFTIIFDDSGKLLASSGYINGQVPVPPSGVFDFARANPDDRITWTPLPTARIATVVKHFSAVSNPSDATATGISGFIVAGHNIRESENRDSRILFLIGVAWVGLIVITFFATLFTGLITRPRQG